MFNGRKTLLYFMLGVMLSLAVSSVLYFGVYPVTSSKDSGRTAEGDFMMSGDITFLVNVTQLYPDLVKLTADKVKINGGVSTYSSGTIDAARWIEDRYYLDVTGASGNSIHAIIQFYFFTYSSEQNADIYGIRITAATTPNPDDRFWKVDNSGIDDPNGPVSEVRATVRRTNLLEGEPRLPTDAVVDASYYRKWGYTVVVIKQSVLSGESVDFAWKLGLDTTSDDRLSAIAERSSTVGTYLLVLTVTHQETLHIDDLQFKGNLWRSGFPPSVENLWASIKDIDINYYSQP